MANRFAFELRDEGGQLIHMEEVIEGRQGELYKFDFGVKVAVDKATGKVTGIREYETLKVTKPICKSSPIIFQKLCEGKKLKQAVLRFYRHDPNEGDERHFYTIMFENLSIVAQRPIGLDTTSEQTRHLPPLEEVAMVAEKITQTFVEGNIEYKDEYRKKEALVSGMSI